jgi:hypothetical protein
MKISKSYKVSEFLDWTRRTLHRARAGDHSGRPLPAGFRIATLWPQQNPEFAILSRDGLRLQLGKAEASGSGSNATLWLDVEELAALYSTVQNRASIEWGPEVYSYGRREFGFRDPDGNWVIVSEVTSDPPTCLDN